MKRYIAKSNVSINILLASGVNRHITFTSLTSGGSVFYTDDPEIEKAMESHYKFGTLFRIDQGYRSEEARIKPPKENIASASVPGETGTLVGSVSDIESEESRESEYKTVVVTDPDAAKAYLAEHFGISRTKIKTIKAIKEVGASNGVKFQGI